MFVIELIYKSELREIDAHMRAHMAYLRKYYGSGRFVASGRQVPRTGGVILARGGTKDELETIVKEDPFVALGLADYRLIEFRVSQRAPSLDALFQEE